MGQVINKDVKFDRYGDYSFFGNDINTVSSAKDILYQNIIDRLISNFNDYELDPTLGADISSNIGRRNSLDLEVKIKEKVKAALVSDSFLDPNEVVITTMREDERIFLRISILQGTSRTMKELFKINTIFNTSSGLLYATN
jgi:hypothetical protein